MSRQRTLRRAAERAAQKSLAATADPSSATLQTNSPDPRQYPESATPISEARLTANRANAQHSTGPITPAGKSVSSLNALKHGLTGSSVLLDSDDAALYQTQLDAHVEQFRPEGYEERRLVQSMHDCAWRLDRILMLESAIYARGRNELSPANDDQPSALRKHFLLLDISERYAKQLRNLHIQESRLQRQRAKDMQALSELQAERRTEKSAEDEEAEQAAAGEAMKSASSRPLFGFDFANGATGSQPAPFTTVAALPTSAGKDEN